MITDTFRQKLQNHFCEISISFWTSKNVIFHIPLWTEIQTWTNLAYQEWLSWLFCNIHCNQYWSSSPCSSAATQKKQSYSDSILAFLNSLGN